MAGDGAAGHGAAGHGGAGHGGAGHGGAGHGGAGHGGAGDVTARITLIGKPGCHLCDEARVVVERVARDTGSGWSELSILDDDSLADKYWEQIPVVLVDGKEHDFWRVDEGGLRAALAGRRSWLRRR